MSNTTGKGVCTAVIPKEHMPRDKHGTYADIVVSSSSSIHRMNTGRILYQAYSAYADQILRDLKNNFAEGDWEGKYDYYREFIGIASPYMANILDGVLELKSKKAIIEQVFKENNRIYVPHYTPELGTKIVKKLMERYHLDIGPLTFMGIDGKWKTTKENILIGSIYFIMLEKIGDDWAGVAVPKRQHHGVIAKLSNADKHANAYRKQAIRIFGETEIRILTSVTDEGFTSTITALANSPGMCIDATRTILEAEKPTDIELLVDYRKHQKMEPRSLQYIKHVLQCYGFEFDYIDENLYRDVEHLDGKYYRVDEEGVLQEVNV